MERCELCIQPGAGILFEDSTLSYQDIRRNMSRITDALLEFNPESPIAIILKRSEFMVCVMLACLEAAIAYVMIDPAWPQPRIDHILNECGVEVVITQKEFAGRWGHYQAILMEDISRRIEHEGFSNPFPNRLAYILYTSGSTGKPKGVMVTRANIIAFVENLPKSVSFTNVQQVASFSAAIFDIFFLESVISLFMGLTVVLATEEECKNPRLIEQLIMRHPIDLIQMTPSKMRMLQSFDPQFQCLKSVKRILLGGEPFPLQLLKDLQNFTQATIYNMYGPTETTIWSTVSDLTDSRVIDIGTPLEQTEIYLMDENFKLVRDERVGEICISGSGVSIGYINNPQKTEEAFIALPELPGVRVYRTGDLGKRTAGGKFQWLGRSDNQVKIRGHRIELEGIESVMDACPHIEKSVAFVHSNDGFNQLGLIYLGRDGATEEALDQFARQQLPEYMLPNFYIKGDVLFYTDNGKLDRRQTAEYYIQLMSMKNKNCEEKPNVDADVVLKIVGDNLMFHEINMATRLMDIGMDSITFIKIIVEIESQFNFEFEDHVLSVRAFEKVSDLIDYVDAHKFSRIEELKR